MKKLDEKVDEGLLRPMERNSIVKLAIKAVKKFASLSKRERNMKKSNRFSFEIGFSSFIIHSFKRLEVKNNEQTGTNYY